MAKRLWITLTLLLIAVGIAAGVGFEAERTRRRAEHAEERFSTGPAIIVRGEGENDGTLRRL